MIRFVKVEYFLKFGNLWQSDPQKTIIDLRDCQSDQEYVLEIEKYMHGSDSCRLQTGNSLDALSDVIQDYFYEQWLKSPAIYVFGWKSLMDRNPILSQQILSIFYFAHRNVVWGNARAAYEGEASLKELKIHDEIQDGAKINLVLN